MWSRPCQFFFPAPSSPPKQATWHIHQNTFSCSGNPFLGEMSIHLKGLAEVPQTWYWVYGFCFVLHGKLSALLASPSVSSRCLTIPLEGQVGLLCLARWCFGWCLQTAELPSTALPKEKTRHWALVQFRRCEGAEMVPVSGEKVRQYFSLKKSGSLYRFHFSASASCLQEPSLAGPI